MSAQIVAATITYALRPLDVAIAGGSARATLTLEDGTTEQLVWYHDEVTITEADLVGRTMSEARDLHRERDLAYLRSPS